MAFRLCREISCPHPKYLDRYGIEMEELNDWHAFYLWENQPAEKEVTDEDRVDTLKYLRSEWDE